MTEQSRPYTALKLTIEEIEKKRTSKGGFTRDTLAQWGVPWPPPKGWRKALIKGRPIPYGSFQK